MSDSTNPQNPSDSPKPKDTIEESSADPQPESGFVDRAERMTIRQSSPMNPRVSEKSEENQEEA